MKHKSLTIVMTGIIMFILNIIVFFVMSTYVKQMPTFINQAMYYLSVILIIASIVVSYFGYRDLSNLTIGQKIVIHVTFWIHLIGLGIFLGTLWYSII